MRGLYSRVLRWVVLKSGPGWSKPEPWFGYNGLVQIACWRTVGLSRESGMQSAEMNRMHLVLFGTHNRTFGSYLATQGRGEELRAIEAQGVQHDHHGL
jgi:hypothetical protein